LAQSRTREVKLYSIIHAINLDLKVKRISSFQWC